MKLISACLLAWLFALHVFAQTSSAFMPRNGDLLFQDLRCGALCDAIEKVTVGVNNLKFSHMGLVCMKENQPFVIEALGNNVQLTPLDVFLQRSVDAKGKPRAVVGEIPDSMRAVADTAVMIALSQIGMPYDDAFLPNNGKWYCSELIAYAFNKAAHRTLFPNAPMTFKDPESGAFMPAWIEYYNELEQPIPEGKPGCNPGGMSRAPFLKIEMPYSEF